jgi:hypothetical protein
VPNLVVTPVGADGEVDFYNSSAGTVQVIADVSGYVGSGTVENGSWLGIVGPLPLASSGFSAWPSSVACPGTGVCVAVGAYDAWIKPNTVVEALIDTLSNGTWTAIQPPLPANTQTVPPIASELDSVSCPAVGTCVAVGRYTNTDLEPQGLIDTLSHGAWTQKTAPMPSDAVNSPRASTGLTSVTCRAVGTCVAVGAYNGGLMIDSLNNGTWVSSKAPLPADADPTQPLSFTSVSCSRDGTCAAVGSYQDSTNNQYGLIETLTAARWTASGAPLPPSTSRVAQVFMNSVSCGGGGTCAAVGSSGNRSLIETLSGGTWTGTAAPLPADSVSAFSNSLNAVSCPSPGTCTAVGNSSNTAANALVERLRDGTWTTAAAAMPTTIPPVSSSLSSVSCSPIAICVAAGMEDGVPLIETLSDLTAAPVQTPFLPPDATNAGTLNAVACAPEGTCATVGTYISVHNGQEGLIITEP